MLLRPPISTIFPYTTLFRSTAGRHGPAPADDRPAVGWGRVAHLDSALGFSRHHSEGHDHDDLHGFLDGARAGTRAPGVRPEDRKSTRLNSSHLVISYAVFCLNAAAPTYLYHLPLHDALPIYGRTARAGACGRPTRSGVGACRPPGFRVRLQSTPLRRARP